MGSSGNIVEGIKSFFLCWKKPMGSIDDKNILDLILPKGVLEYFSLTDFTCSSEINLYLEEKNVVPEEYKNDKLTSKGFFDQITSRIFHFVASLYFCTLNEGGGSITQQAMWFSGTGIW